MQAVFNKMNFGWPKLAILLWLVVQIPFLTADVPSDLSYSRGPYSDEGLNTFAIRNWINSDFEDFPESDNFIKSPLMNVFLAFPFWIAKNDLVAGRLSLVLCSVLILLMLPRYFKTAFLIPLLLIIFPSTFHFSRLMMGDFLSVLFPVVGLLVFLLKRTSNSSFSFLSLFLLVLFTSLGVGMKIQSAVLFVFVMFIMAIYTLKGISYRNQMLAILLGVLPVLLIYAFVIFRNLDLFNYIFKQVPEYIESESLSFSELFTLNKSYLFQNDSGLFLEFLVGISCLHLLILMARFKWKAVKAILPIFGVFLIQLSGMFTVYFPPRYAVGLYVAVIVLTAYVLYFLQQEFKTYFLGLSIMIIAIGLYLNGNAFVNSYEGRAFKVWNKISEIDKSSDGEVLLGSWAPMLTLGSDTKRAFPVWHSYLNYKQIIAPFKYYKADLVVIEPNEEDSDGAYKKRGIEMNQYPLIDSLKISRFSLEVFKVQ